jgi:radical SAM protein with 4Fe4S-binding SPASM domain
MTFSPGLDDFGRAPAAVPEPAAGPQRAADRLPAVPHVVAWNLTARCNLACAHCYISAGPWHGDGGELTFDEVRRIADQVLELNPSPMFILSGGEPLLRDDLEAIARHATAGGATVVVGTNGTRLTDERIGSLIEAGVRGVAVSVDSLDERYHDRFRHGGGALEDTLAAVERLGRARLDFIVQTTVTRGNRGELERLAAWSAAAGAVCFNVYFLVETGRGEGMRSLEPEENEAVLGELVELGRRYRGAMMVRSKCQPAIMRRVHRDDPSSPLLHYATRCPCGVQYCRITPEGKLTPCPYLPAVAGDLRRQSFAEVWRGSPLFAALRGGELGGKCGRCEYRVVCGGCRARAFAATGDPLAEDASCAYQPAPGPPAEPVRPAGAVYGAPYEAGGGRAGDQVAGRAGGQAGGDGAETAPGPVWSEAARARMERIPSFVRGVVARRIEGFAERHGVTEITPELLDRVRREMPVDFSRRRPFFSRDDGDG